MTTIIHDDLQIPAHPIAQQISVLVIAEHDLTDIALVALVQRFGYSAAVVDLDSARTVLPTTKAVIVRSVARCHQLEMGRHFAGCSIIGIGVGVEHLGGIELPDSPFATGSLQRTLTAAVGPRAAGRDPVHLSRREREVVVAYTLGATVRETASRHFISESTVRSHFRRVMRRYAEAGRPVNNKTQLLLELIADGWVERRQLVKQGG